MNQAEEDELRIAAAWAVTRGSLLFHLDLAGSLARDHVAARGLAPDADGWAVDVGPNGYEVCFVGGDPLREMIAVTFAADGAPLAERRDGTPGWRVRTLAAAAATAAAATAGPERRSIIVVPPAAATAPGDAIEAYAMRRAGRPGDVAFGMHERLILSGDGTRLLERIALSRTALLLEGSAGRPPADITVTHLLGPVPSEAHVYLSLKHGVPLSVITTDNEEHWVVDGEQISLL